MSPDLVFERSENDTEASGSKEIPGNMDEPKDRYTRCTSNCQDTTFEMGAAGDEEDGRSNDEEVDILHCTNAGDVGLLEPPCQDVTESSSSFSDTVSENQSAMGLSEGEVQSGLHDDASSALPFDEDNKIFRLRKKRLTTHWRTFVRPIAWRCKWLELQIKKFQDLAMKYDREIAVCNKKKQSEADKYMSEDFSAKSHPFSFQRKEVMKRKKRKRIEESADVASYMGHHNLFSYYERSADNASLLTDKLGNQEKPVNGSRGCGTEVSDEFLVLHELRDSQTSLELILRKIEKVHSKAGTMKARLNKIIHAESFVVGNTLASPDRNHPPCNNGDKSFLESSSYAAIQQQQHIPTKDSLGGGLVMSGNAASSHGKIAPPYAAADIVNRAKVALPENVGDGMLIYSRRAKQEVDDDGVESVNVVQQPTERCVVVKAEEQQHNSFPPPEEVAAGYQPAPKIRSLANLNTTTNNNVTSNTRKGNRRRSVSARFKE